MSQRDVEVIAAAFAAFQQGGRASVSEFATPDIVVTQFPDQLDVRDYRGHDGLEQVMAEWIGTWDDWSIQLLRAREVDGHVLATAFQRGRGRSSGVPMEAEVAFLFRLREGAIVRWRMFHSEQEALEALASP